MALRQDGLILVQMGGAIFPSGTKSWLDLWQRVPGIAGGSGLALLLSGGYLTHRMSAGTEACPKGDLAALHLIGVLGGVTSRRMRALRRTSARDQSEFFRRRGYPILRISLSLRIALVFAAVLLMNAKPQLRESLSVVGAALVLGLFAAFLIPSRESLSSAPISSTRGLFDLLY